eukprot:2554460-Amphidinium_carterae.2
MSLDIAAKTISRSPLKSSARVPRVALSDKIDSNARLRGLAMADALRAVVALLELEHLNMAMHIYRSSLLPITWRKSLKWLHVDRHSIRTRLQHSNASIAPTTHSGRRA